VGVSGGHAEINMCLNGYIDFSKGISDLQHIS